MLANFQSNETLVSMMSKNVGTFGMKMWLVQGAGGRVREKGAGYV